MSLSILSYLEPTNEILISIFKWGLVLASSGYALRVYFLNSYLSIIHSNSKKLHSALCSLLARSNILTREDRIRLLFILEDVSCHYNKMSYRNIYDRTVDQGDVLSSILSTLEIFLLLSALAFRQK